MVIIGMLIGLTAFTFLWGIFQWVLTPRMRVSQRVSAMHAVSSHGAESEKRVRKQGRRSQMAARFMVKLDSVLRRAEIDLTAREYLIRWGLVTLCGMLVAVLALGASGGLLALACSGFGTLFYLRTRANGRTRRFNEGLHDMLTIVSNSLRAGHSFVQSLHLVAQDVHGPMQEELQRVEAELQYGAGIEEALERANERIGSEDFDLVVTAILIQRQVGGNLAEVLEKISDTIRDRVRLKREVKALTSQGRLSATIFMVLPIAVGILLYIINPSYIGALFSTPLGLGMLLIAAVGQGVGYAFIRRIVNVEL